MCRQTLVTVSTDRNHKNRTENVQGVTAHFGAHSGKYCLLLRGIDYIEQAFNPPIISTSDLTFWAKTDRLAGEANVTIGYAIGIKNTIQFGGSELTLEWKLFTVSIDQIQQIKRIQFSTWVTDSIFIDDVSFSNQITVVSKIDIITKSNTESVSKLESISKSINNDLESVIPGFIFIPTLIGLVVIVLIVSKRRI